MKNIAKCKLCQSIIESHFKGDCVTCKCGEIGVYNGLAMDCEARNWENFLRVDDLGNEIVVKYIDRPAEKEGDESQDCPPKELTYNAGIEMLDQLIKNIEELPDHVKLSSVNHYDLVSFMLVISTTLKKLTR